MIANWLADAELHAAALGLAATAALALPMWLLSVIKRDVSIVDSIWSLMQLSAGLAFIALSTAPGTRAWLCMALVAVWAVRLSVYLTARNWGEAEDRRYTQIRTRNEPHFAWKSLYLVFGLQALLAWIVALPLLPIAFSNAPLGPLDYIAAALFIIGFLFEAIGDWQLAKFKRAAQQRGNVLRSGLWRYTRHPNYFGEFCMAWAVYLFALASGGWWCLFAPLLVSFLLLRVSGVALLERDIGERRPHYRDYATCTNAFFPWLPRSSRSQS